MFIRREPALRLRQSGCLARFIPGALASGFFARIGRHRPVQAESEELSPTFHFKEEKKNG
ncbi:hypothetical protein D7V90_09995 [bacterium 1xD42-87]|nr:hypothetical protein D7V90_09995 [bacterium 1xD42-87]